MNRTKLTCHKLQRRHCLAFGFIFLLLSIGVVRSDSTYSPIRRPEQTTLAAMSSGIPDAINAFGESLFKALAMSPAKGAGVFLSPFGIAQALGMLLNGVEPGGASATQLQKAVFGGIALPLDALNARMQELSGTLVQGADGNAGLTVSDANSVWVAAKYALQPGYSAALSKYFDARVETITTAQVVNSWVSDATRGKIKEIVDDNALQQSLCVLINALYFKGLWQAPFKTTNTGPVPFHFLEGQQADVAMMFQSFKAKDDTVKVARFKAALPGSAAPSVSAGAGEGYGLGAGLEGEGLPCIAVQLPYQGGDFAAVAAMPEGNLTVGAAGQPLRLQSGVPYSAALAACRGSLLGGLGAGANGALKFASAGMDVKLWMPRFEIEFGTSLSDALRQLGVTQPFAGGDITRVAATAGGAPVTDLQVSDVIHKVYIKTDEKGTEAAAVTAIMMARAMMREPPSVVVRLDRPFVFAVTHRATGAALFVGEVHEPEGWKGE